MARWSLRRIEAEHAHLAAVGVQQPADQADRRGLAGAVGADQAEHLAAADLEGEAVSAVTAS